jgi:ADP-heptose:LPS heptosyltransferase
MEEECRKTPSMREGDITAPRTDPTSVPLPVFGDQLPEMTGPYRARNRRLVAVLRALDLLGHVLPKWRRALPRDRPLRVLVANWGHLGDVITVLPLLKFIEQHPNVGQLGILIGNWSRNALETSDIRARLHTIDHWALDRSGASRLTKIRRYWSQAGSLVRELRSCRYDVSIDTFSTFPVTHGLTWAARIPLRIGFTSAGLGTWLTCPTSWLPIDVRLIDQQVRLLAPLFGPDSPTTLAASYPGFRPVALAANLGLRGKGHVILHMGAGDPTKEWMAEKWAWVAHELRSNGFEVVATGTSGIEAQLAENIANKAGINNLAGRLGWAELVTLLSRAAAVVTVDTVMGHLAACFEIPTVVLTNGRLRPSFWRPNHPRAIPISYPVGCAPCNRTHGCAAMACIRLIEASDVVACLRRLLQDANLKAQDRGQSDSEPSLGYQI